MTGEEKEEKLKELMNRISLALKDTTLQQGFEIICKNLEELEKENEQLKVDMEIADSQRQLAEKENTELTAQVEQLSNDNHVLKTSFIMQQEQIEKMKSFIHSEIDFCMYCPLTNECENAEGSCPYAYATEEEQKNLLMEHINKIGS